jgi:outer membrane autotransporter protein
VESDGINAFGDDNTISNSGLISATGADSYAIDFGGGGNELVLLPGSRIIGRISLGSGSDTITFKNRLSTVLTFDDDGNGNGVPEAINANGLPYVVSGTSVAVLDPSGFNQHDEMLSDLTSGIFNSVHARLAGAGTPRAPQRVGKGFAEPVVRTNTAVWAQVFGGLRDQDDTGLTKGAEHNLAGGIAGLDGLISPTLRLGAFGGLARNDVTVNFNSQDIDADSYFGGVYASFQNSGWFANMIVTAGKTDHDSRRTVLFNLSPTGAQIGRANYDGTFISPEVAIGTRFAAGYVAIEPSVRLRYAHMSLDGYSETGAADALSVRSRDISLWQGRAQIAFPMAASLPGGGVTYFAPRIGIEAWTSDNDAVSAVLLDQSISFNPGGKDDEVTGFVGATASVDIANGASAVIDMEVHGGEEGIVRSEARAGVTINF